MAITKVTRTLLSTGIVDNSNATAITIDSSENVGIGSSSPLAILTSKNTGSLTTNSNDGDHTGFGLFLGKDTLSANTVNTAIGFGNTSSGRKYAAIGMQTYADADQNGLNFYIQSTASGSSAALTEAMRIDSSGNLLVGKTAPTISTTGVELRPNGQVFATQSGNYPLLLNRTTSDGDIVSFRKDGSTVGSIGTQSGRLTIGDGDTGLRFADDFNNIQPFNVTTNVLRDNAIDLGSSAGRFKDLHLSGIANVGTYLRFGGASNYYIHSDNANYLRFGTAGSERMRITATGNLQFKSTTSTFTGASSFTNHSNGILYFRGGTSGLRLDDDSSNNTIHVSGSGNYIAFETLNGTERMRLDSSGNVGIGMSNPAEKLHVYSGTGNVPAKFESGDAYSIITFADSGTSGTVGTGAQNSDLIFYSGDALRMRLSSGGVLSADGVYNTTSSDAANVRVLSNGNIVRSTSSERYKNTITDASKGLTELNNLRPVTYKGNNDGDTVFYGLIAEEVHDAGLTEFVEYNDDNEPDALRYPHMVSLCIKAIQEQQTIIDNLKTRIETLENV